ncbi:hypothetical protein FOA52_005020 [Chlamydomonas sp. UWO 241]|nr:hypothetical protein FOA52_005020 [Chlamydomonas sp. UWO 241]
MAAPAPKHLTIVVTSVNVKKIDQKAYGIKKQMCQVKITVGDKEVKTANLVGLDPQWEETFEFDIVDEKETKVFSTFYMDTEEDQKQIGDVQQFLLPVLIDGKPLYKGHVVPGGVVNMMFTAKGFGKADEPEDTDGLMDLMDGGMEMD